MTILLAESDLDIIWERLAEAIDQAGPERETLFLAKLALLVASELGNGRRTEELVEAALRDLT